MRRALIVLIASLSALAPATAQQPDAPRTYTVREGDTLWAIAERFLKDPFRWADVHKKNADKIRDPHWIYPGQVIDLVDLFGAALDSTAVDTLPEGPLNDPSIFAVRRGTPVRTPVVTPVVSAGPRRDSRALQESAAIPFLVGQKGVRAIGSIGRVIDSGVVGRASRFERPVQLYDRVRLVLPAGASARVDDRFLVFRNGPKLRRRGRVVIPTGIVRVVGRTDGGIVEVQLTASFENVTTGHQITPLDTALAMPGTAASIASGPTVAVLWVDGDALVPSTGTDVIVSMPGDGPPLRLGDEVTFEGRTTAGESGLRAVLRVVRVTPHGATARVVSQGLGRLQRGMVGRVSARVP
jgi:hypothetical protein